MVSYAIVIWCKRNSKSGHNFYQKCILFLMLSFLFITVYQSNTFENSVELYDVTEKKSPSIDEIFEMRRKIMRRSCSFIKQLISANKIATIDELKKIHYLLHDLNIPLDVITSKLERY